MRHVVRSIIVLACLVFACSCSWARQEGTITMADDKMTSRSVDVEPLTPEQAQKLYVGDVDWNRATSLGLVSGEDFEKAYLEVAGSYMALLNDWLVKVYGLDEYQAMLDSHEWKYPVEHDDASALQANGGFGRKNIFIRSTAYVERLSPDDLALVQAHYNPSDKTLAVDDSMEQMLERTWKEVIEVRRLDISEPFDEVYEDRFDAVAIAPNDALVLEILYGREYDDAGKLVSAENEENKQRIVMNLAELMESELGQSIEPVKVFAIRK